MIRRALMYLTRHKPMKTIEVNGAPYLERYYIGQLCGIQFWLHRFRRDDAERHLHTHPWSAMSVMLCGGYIEEREDQYVWRKAPCLPALITPRRMHRIDRVISNTWTLMIVGPRRQSTWAFVNGDERQWVEASPRVWWEGLPCRGGGEYHRGDRA